MQSSGGQLISAGLVTAFALVFVWFWIIALIDVVQRRDDEFPSGQPGPNPRLLWSVIVVLLGGVGGFIYYVSGDEDRIRDAGVRRGAEVSAKRRGQRPHSAVTGPSVSMVETKGLEPSTSGLQSPRSPS